MLKQAMAVAAVVASVVGATAAAAPQALALGDDGRTTSTGSTAAPAIDSAAVPGTLGDPTAGDGMSPQSSLVPASLDRLGAGLPARTGTGSVIGAVPVATQDTPLLPGGRATAG
ncbi:RdlA protein [Streptomyces sp. NPDC093261]|uniref:RdlA protein n=1 Tax=Streptomyces sp. NPDC093261 TaxID=3366037 RepID=UPI00381BB90F